MKSKFNALIQLYIPFFNTKNHNLFFAPSPLKAIILNLRFYSTTAVLFNKTFDDRIEPAGIGGKPLAADVLRSWGCSENEVTKVFLRQPRMRKMEPNNLWSKLKMLSDLGIGSSDLVKMVNCRPCFLSARINHCLDERIEYLESLFGSREVLIKAIVRNPSLLTYDLHHKMKPAIAMYERVGFSKKDLVPMLISHPTMIPRCNLDDKKLDYIQRTGVSRDSKMYKYVVTIISISRIETIQEKMENLEKFGFSEDEVFSLFGRSPLVLTLSTDKVQKNMTFIVAIMKLSSRTVLTYPCLLYFNLESCLKPRYFLGEKINDMGLAPKIKGPNMMRALRMTEKRFIDAFINCHPENIAKQLMDFYASAKCIKRLAETSNKSLHIGFPF